MCDARLWQDMQSALLGSGYKTKVVDTARHDRLSDMAAHALAHLPQTFVAVGFSMGGMVALEMAKQAPDRLSGLILSATHARADYPDRAATRLKQQLEVRKGGLEAIVRQSWLPSYFGSDAAKTLHQDLIMAMAMSEGPEVFLRQSEALRLRSDQSLLLPEIDIPCLIIAGRKDRICPVRWHEAMQGHIRKSQLHIIDKAGHFALLEANDNFMSAIKIWLSSHPVLER
jgi:pimeloyl-ACP methyl ester carboxylesterase